MYIRSRWLPVPPQGPSYGEPLGLMAHNVAIRFLMLADNPIKGWNRAISGEYSPALSRGTLTYHSGSHPNDCLWLVSGDTHPVPTNPGACKSQGLPTEVTWQGKSQ